MIKARRLKHRELHDGSKIERYRRSILRVVNAQLNDEATLVTRDQVKGLLGKVNPPTSDPACLAASPGTSSTGSTYRSGDGTCSP